MSEPLVHKSTFPPPPPFYTLYSKNAIASQPDLLEPPPPLNESFVKFGTVQSDDFLVHDLGSTPQLYDSNASVSRSLRRLCRSTAQTFIELLDALLDKQNQLPDRLSHLRCLFINIAHVLNKLRAHQARQTVIILLQKQIKARRQKIAQLQAQSQRAGQFLADHGLGNDSMAVDKTRESISPLSEKITEMTSKHQPAAKEAEQDALLTELYNIWRNE